MTGGVLIPSAVMGEALPLALIVAFAASALPYALEMVALRIVPPQAFGVLMSLEPAVAALLGFLILGEVLMVSQWAAIACIIAASLLVTLGRKAE
jgi:inner membrane transporter RhtA